MNSSDACMAAARHLHAVCALQLVGIEQMARWCTRAGVALPVDRMLAFNDELDLGAPIDVADVATLRVRACVRTRTHCLQALLQVHQLLTSEHLLTICTALRCTSAHGVLSAVCAVVHALTTTTARAADGVDEQRVRYSLLDTQLKNPKPQQLPKTDIDMERLAANLMTAVKMFVLCL